LAPTTVTPGTPRSASRISSITSSERLSRRSANFTKLTCTRALWGVASKLGPAMGSLVPSPTWAITLLTMKFRKRFSVRPSGRVSVTPSLYSGRESTSNTRRSTSRAVASVSVMSVPMGFSMNTFT